MSQLKISVNAREETGRGVNHRLRTAGKIPCVIYSKGNSRSVSVDNKAFGKLWHELIGRTPLVTLSEGGKDAQVMIQAVQRHPIKDHFLHIDFYEVTAGEEMTAQVALHVIGEPHGVKTEGGNLEIHLHEVEVRALPGDLPDFIEVDVSAMKIGDALHLTDLPKLAGVEYQLHEDTVLVSVAGVKLEVEPVEAEVAADEVPATEVGESSEEEDA